MENNILDTIVVKKLQEIEVAKLEVSVAELKDSEFFSRECYSLPAFIKAEDRSGIIAEFKRQSPSKGVINSTVSVTEVTQGYAAAGASAISILTDSSFFGGHKNDLIEARRSVEVPLLRKDFMLDEYQVYEAKAWGADIILLIAAILSPARIKELAALAKSLTLSVLLEVHNIEELERSLCNDLDAVGVNNRNLGNFSVTTLHSFNLVNHIPNKYLKISESGISDPAIISELKQVGFDGFLIGENFMKQSDPGKAMFKFVSEIAAG